MRSFRRNALKNCTLVKVAVDGAPYLRKVDLEAYSGYEQLLTALEEMFSCFTARKSNSYFDCIECSMYLDGDLNRKFSLGNYLSERKLVDPANGTEYVPTYEDSDGDVMLVGDVPWK